MAGAGYRLWIPGDIPTATQVNTLWQEQVIPVFASAAARDTALSTVKAEGMHAYLADTNTVTVYTGAAWSTTGPVQGALTTWTPVLTQSGTVTTTLTYRTLSRSGRQVAAQFRLDATGAGTAANAITVSLPFTAAVSGSQPIGVGWFFDSSTSGIYKLVAVMTSTTVMSFLDTSTTGGVTLAAMTLGSGANTFAGALAAGDALTAEISFEAAADA